MRVLENEQIVDYSALSHDPAQSKGAVPTTWSEMMRAGGGALDTELPFPRQAAFDTVDSFVDANEYGFSQNTDAIASAIFGDLQAKRTANELTLIEQIIKEVIEGAAMPKVQVVGNGNIYASTQDTLLPSGVLGAFVAGEDGEPGTILISKDIEDKPDLLAAVMLEEVGEAIGHHVHHELSVHPSYDYGDPAPGDVGNRIMQVVRGKPVGEVEFKVTDGGLLEDDPDFDPERDYDERYVLFDGAVTVAKTAADDDPHLEFIEDVFEDGGVGFNGSSLDASEAVQADILADNPAASLREGFPDLDWMGNATEINVVDLDLVSGPAIRVTGTWEVEQSVGGRQGAAGVTEIVEVSDSVTLKVKQVGDEKYLEIMLPQEASNGKNVDEDRAFINPTYVASSKENAVDQVNHVQQAIAGSSAADKPVIDYSYDEAHISATSSTAVDTPGSHEGYTTTDEDIALAEEWGIEDPYQVSLGRVLATEIYDRRGFTGDQGYTAADSNATGWNQMLRIYGMSNGGDAGGITLQREELIRAIADGAFKTTINSAGETVFEHVNLNDASYPALTDAIWAHAEINSQDGGARAQVSLDLLQDAVAYVTGDADGFVTDADRKIIQTHYADVFFGDETRENGEPGASRFSKDAILNIWETGGFIRTAVSEPDIIDFSVSATNAEAVAPAEPTDPTVGESLTDPVYVDDGVWYGFGYYGDNDGDALLNGVDDNSGAASYDLVDIPAEFDLPEGAVLTSVLDFGSAASIYGVPNVRGLNFVDPVTGADVYAVHDMTLGSATYGQAIVETKSHTDGSLEARHLDEEPHIMSAAEVVEMETEAESLEENTSRRTSESGYDTASEEELANYVETEIPGATIIETFGHNNIAWVVYTDNVGDTHAIFKYAQVESVSEYMAKTHDPVYGYISQNDPEWDAFKNAYSVSELIPGAEDDWIGTAPGVAEGVAVKGVADWWGSHLIESTYANELAHKNFGTAYLAAQSIQFFQNGLKTMFYQNQADAQFTNLIGSIETSTTIDGTTAPVGETDPGVIGTGYSGWWIPDDATLTTDPEFLVAQEDSYYDFDVIRYVYTREDDPDTQYSVDVIVDDPDAEEYGLVVQAASNDGTTFKLYDSEGNVLTELQSGDVEDAVQEVDPTLVLETGEDTFAELLEVAATEGEVTGGQANGNLAYVDYTTQQGEDYMIYEITDDDGASEGTFTVTADSIVATEVKQISDLFDRAAVELEVTATGGANPLQYVNFARLGLNMFMDPVELVDGEFFEVAAGGGDNGSDGAPGLPTNPELMNLAASNLIPPDEATFGASAAYSSGKGRLDGLTDKGYAQLPTNGESPVTVAPALTIDPALPRDYIPLADNVAQRLAELAPAVAHGTAAINEFREALAEAGRIGGEILAYYGDPPAFPPVAPVIPAGLSHLQNPGLSTVGVYFANQIRGPVPGGVGPFDRLANAWADVAVVQNEFERLGPVNEDFVALIDTWFQQNLGESGMTNPLATLYEPFQTVAGMYEWVRNETNFVVGMGDAIAAPPGFTPNELNSQADWGTRIAVAVGDYQAGSTPILNGESWPILLARVSKAANFVRQNPQF